MKQAEISLLWIGTAQRELAEARAFAAGVSAVSVVDKVDVAAATAWLIQQSCAPELVVITQFRPGEMGHEQIDRLRRAAPLARLVALLGSWCEGEARSGHPWLAVERVYWHQWPSWLARELKQYSHQRSAWALPITATAEDRLLAAVCHLAPRRASPRGARCHTVVGIISHRRESAQMLVDACREFGPEAIVLDGSPGRLSGLSLAIWDADRCDETEADQILQLAAAIRPAPLVVLLTCPRIEESQRALAAGASTVFSKPLMLEELFFNSNCSLPASSPG